MLVEEPLQRELGWLIESARAPRIRPHTEFAESELVIPEGKFEGRKWRPYRQPYGRLLFDAFASGRWPRVIVLGPVQSGKTFHGFVALIIYHAFERRETIVVGVPSMDVAWDKWSEEIRPVLERTRFARQIPSTGRGSRGGSFESIRFRNGTTLKFMTGAERKALAFTTRVVIVTEADKLCEAGEASNETSPIRKLEARSYSYDAPERVFVAESTVTTEDGYVWAEYIRGTNSRIACPCPHCGEWVTPEREHLVGWQGAADLVQAGLESHFVCPSCEHSINDAERNAMNQAGILVHRGQTVDKDGTIHGDSPPTDTLGFRWNAFNNLFWSISTIGQREWKAKNAPEDASEDDEERELCQYVWAIPYVPPRMGIAPLSINVLKTRTSKIPRGVCPVGTSILTMGVDVQLRLLYWFLRARRSGGQRQIVDWRVVEVHSDNFDTDQAFRLAFDELNALIDRGWPCEDGGTCAPDAVWVDSGDWTDTIYATCKSLGDPWRPSKGFGYSQIGTPRYNRPKKTGSTVRWIGEECHVARVRNSTVGAVDLAEFNSDHWKTQVRSRLAMPAGEVGADVFPDVAAKDLFTLIKHLTAEEAKREYDSAKGRWVEKWIQKRAANHWLDADAISLAAEHWVTAQRTKAKELTGAMSGGGSWWGKPGRKRR